MRTMMSKIYASSVTPSLCRVSCLLSCAVAVTILLVWWWSSHPQLSDPAGGKYDGNEHLEPPRRIPSKGLDASPVLAYWILGSAGDSKKILRLLKAVYHPRNQYLLHLDSSSQHSERLKLAIKAHSDTILREFGNVNVVGKSYSVNQAGASGLAALLHAAALLLKLSADWDWFVPLTASDYPIYTQHDILYAFTGLPRDLNFVGYANDTACSNKRPNVSRIAIDPSLYLGEKNPIFYAAETRQEPDAFQTFRGSPRMMLSRGFLEHCVNGWDNLPRKLLMYFSNVAFPLESYFQTVLCNTPEFQNTTVNHSFIRSSTNMKEDDQLHQKEARLASEAIFATGPFQFKEIIVDERQQRCLKTPAGQAADSSNSDGEDLDDLCWVGGGRDIDGVEAGARGVELKRILSRIVEERRSMSCCKRAC